MTQKNNSSDKNTPDRFKDLMKEAEKSEEEANQLASRMEHGGEDVSPSTGPEARDNPSADLPTLDDRSHRRGIPRVREREEGQRNVIQKGERSRRGRGAGQERERSGSPPRFYRSRKHADTLIDSDPEPPSSPPEVNTQQSPAGVDVEGVQPDESPKQPDHPGPDLDQDSGAEGPPREEGLHYKETLNLADTPPGAVETTPPQETAEGESRLDPASDPAVQETEVIPEPQLPQAFEETPPPPLGDTPQTPPPALDTRGMPLPRRMDQPQKKGQQSSTLPPREEKESPKSGLDLPRRWAAFTGWWKRSGPGKWNWSRGMGCLLRMSIIGTFVIVILAIILGSVGLYHYNRIASTLPDVENLREQAAKFETTRILDRHGNELYEILDPNAGRRTYVSLEEISPYLVAATIATEDSHFYSHPGYDIFAIARAFYSNLVSDEIVSGASTITQQLTRMLLLSPEERSRRTYTRKLREAILAAEITRRYSKDEILELYMNEIYYGNLAYGVEAAAQTYFGTSAKNLDLAQASFLAGIPQLPAVYDVYSNRELTLNRHEQVLVLMYQASQEQGCIYVSNNQQRICIGAGEAASAAEKMKTYEFQSPRSEMRYPHWVNFIRAKLENRYDAQTIYRSGFTVHTTLDPDLQDSAQTIVQEQIANLEGHRVSNGALVAIKPTSGEILALVGSAEFGNEEIQGEINMALSPRQPGSSIKPLTYLASFEQGWTPATLIWDVPSEFPPSGDPNDPRPPYKPVNYDERFHGPVTVRGALANSYNVPAVKTLDFVGIYDDPETPAEDGLVPFARRMGITTLNRDDYGLSLTLGGGDVTLLELTGAYATMANSGRQIPPVAITRIEDHGGNVVFDYQTPSGEQVIRPEHAFLISSILSDNEARTPAFGPNSTLNLPFQAAAKTGTTNDFRDNWTLGYTPDLAVGVWVGNADYTPMQDTSGLTGAAPIWADFMKTGIQDLTGGNPSTFVRPAGVVERVICAVSGTLPSKWCPRQRSEFFAADQLPEPAEEDLWNKVEIDTWTEKLASSACSNYTEEELGLNVDDPWAIKWIRKTSQGQNWAKDMGLTKYPYIIRDNECDEDDPRPVINFASPREGDVITSNPLKIFAKADATGNFESYRLEYGPGKDPVQWEVLEEGDNPVTETTEMHSWDVSELSPGWVTLRIYMKSTNGGSAEERIHLDMQVPTPTPTPTSPPTPSATFTPTPTPPATPTSTPTDTPTPTPSATPSPTASRTPTASPTTETPEP